MMWPGPLSPASTATWPLSATSTVGYGNYPLPPEPPLADPAESQGVDRHVGMLCMCSLLDCHHNELPGEVFGRGGIESGSPRSGYLWPWEPGEWEQDQRYWDRPDPDEYPEGSLERLVVEAELQEWRRREAVLRGVVPAPEGQLAVRAGILTVAMTVDNRLSLISAPLSWDGHLRSRTGPGPGSRTWGDRRITARGTTARLLAGVRHQVPVPPRCDAGHRAGFNGVRPSTR